MLTISAVVVGCVGLLVTLTLLQVWGTMARAHLAALAASSVAFLLLSTFGVYSLVHAQALEIGTLCAAVIILINIAQLIRRRYVQVQASY